MRNIVIAFFISSLISCQLTDKDHISLSTNLIHFNAEGGNECITINSNIEWYFLSSIPEWCRIERIGNTGIRVFIAPNKNNTHRTCSVFVGNDSLYSLFTIEQEANESNAFQISVLPFNDISNVEYRTDGCGITAEKLFIPNEMLETIRIGGLIENTADDVNGFIYHNEYIINPVTVSAVYGGNYYDEIWTESSYGRLENFASRIIENSGKQSALLNYSSPIAFHTYQQLDYIGRLNISKSLAEIIGLSLTSSSTDFNSGLVYSISQELFKISMDYPEQLTTVPIDAEIATKLLYINSVVYGRTSIMIALSKLEQKEMANEINKVLQSKDATNLSSPILENTQFFLIKFDEGKNIQTVSGGQEIIGDFKRIDETQIIPLSITFNTYAGNSVGSIHFSIKY